MGCSSSKPVLTEEKRASERIDQNEVVNINLPLAAPSRAHSTQSKDSGIELYPSEIHEADSNSTSSHNLLEHVAETNSGIAFEVNFFGNENFKFRKEPNRIQVVREPKFSSKYLTSSLQQTQGNEFTLNDINERQAEAARRREANRLVIISKQRRRQLKAQKVLEKRKHQIEDRFEDDQREDLSDADGTYNVDYNSEEF